MKVRACLIYIAAVIYLQVTAEAAVLNRDQIELDAAVRLVVEHFQRLMPCGIKQFNIPVLAPFHLDHYEVRANESLLHTSGHVSNFYITGLEKQQILALNFNNSTKRFFFDILFNEIQILGEYNLESNFYLDQIPVNISGEGLINKKISDLRFVGEFVLAPANENPIGLRIENFSLKINIADIHNNNFNNRWDHALNQFVNKFCSEAALMWIQQEQDRVIAQLLQLYVQLANDKLANVSEEAALRKIVDLIVLLETVECAIA